MSFTTDDSDGELSELQAMELAMNAISTGDIDAFEQQRSNKRTRTDAELPTRPSSPNPEALSTSTIETSQPRRTGGLNATQIAQAIITAKKRKTEHAADLNAFAELQDMERMFALYDALLEIRYLLRHQFAENDNWTLSKNMKDDIRSYAQAVILAPAIPTYMPDASSIQTLLKSKGIYPTAWTIFPSRLNAIRQYTGTCATNARADLKDAIKDSLKTKTCLSALCETIIANTDLKVTAAMRSRVAWLRFIYANHEAHRGNKFWDFVDEQLRELRKKMNNDTRRLATFMAVVVDKDEKRYLTGNENAYSLTEDADLPQFQAAAHTAAKAILPTVPKAS